MALEIMKVLVLSTGHLSPETREEMPGAAPATCVTWEYGWWVWIPTEWLEHYSVPADLVCALKFGEANGCEWVRFDSDGPSVEGLALFDE